MPQKTRKSKSFCLDCGATIFPSENLCEKCKRKRMKDCYHFPACFEKDCINCLEVFKNEKKEDN